MTLNGHKDSVVISMLITYLFHCQILARDVLYASNQQPSRLFVPTLPGETATPLTQNQPRL